MKTLSIVFLFFLVLKFNSYGQETSTLNKTWTIATISMGQYVENNAYSTLEDTIINSKKYKAIYKSNDSIFNVDNSEYHCSYRADKQKWYFVPKGESKEYLLYDFNLEVNDTVVINNPWANGEIELIAFEIDSISLNGGKSKRIAVGYYDNPSGNPYILGHWVEDFGSTSGLFYSGSTLMDLGFQLLCYHNNGDLIYLNSPNNSCGYLSTGLRENALSETINVYPNPASEVLYVENDFEITKVVIFDILGKRIDDCEIRTNENPIRIDIENYPKCFLIQIIGNDFISVKKVIKE